jgi:hypothetical protein
MTFNVLLKTCLSVPLVFFANYMHSHRGPLVLESRHDPYSFVRTNIHLPCLCDHLSFRLPPKVITSYPVECIRRGTPTSGSALPNLSLTSHATRTLHLIVFALRSFTGMTMVKHSTIKILTTQSFSVIVK